MSARTRTVAATADFATIDPSHLWRMVGLLIVSLTSAAFWTGLVALIGYLVGGMPGANTLIMTASGIALFLTLACAPLMLPQRATR